jgi:hypothetical protein
MATMQSFRRVLAVTLAVAGLVASVRTAKAGDWMPLLPDQDFYDFQLFAPPDLRSYSNYQRPREGLFFNYNRLYWGMTVPRAAPVGRKDVLTDVGASLIPTQPINPGSVVNLNNQLAALGVQNGGLVVFGSDELQLDLNTTWMQTAMTWGNRYEVGWIYDDRGVKIDYFSSGVQNQDFTTLNQFAVNSPFNQLQTNVAVSLLEVEITRTLLAISPQPDHVITQSFSQVNQTELQSAAAVMMVRRALGGRGSGSDAIFTFGPRFLQVDDRFSLRYASTTAPFNAGTAPQTTSTTVTSGQGGQVSQSNTGAGTSAGLSSNINTTGSGTFIDGAGLPDVVGQQARYQDAAWATHTINNMVGPEFALRLENTQGRWTYFTDFKFTPAFNWQNNRYRGANLPATIAADYLRTTFQFTQDIPSTLPPPPLVLQIFGLEQENATVDADYDFVFSPIGEWRLGAEFRVSQGITLNLGYTGMWIGSIARASTNTGYNTDVRPVQFAAAPNTPDNPTDAWVVVTKDVPYNRIGPAAGVQQNLFVNGVDFGIEFSY